MELYASCLSENSGNQSECGKEYMGISYCLGSVLCPDLSQKLLSSLETNSEKQQEVAWEEMMMCITNSPLAKSLIQKAAAEQKDSKSES
jgi:hypothetical protein